MVDHDHHSLGLFEQDVPHEVESVLARCPDQANLVARSQVQHPRIHRDGGELLHQCRFIGRFHFGISGGDVGQGVDCAGLASTHRTYEKNGPFHAVSLSVQIASAKVAPATWGTWLVLGLQSDRASPAPLSRQDVRPSPSHPNVREDAGVPRCERHARVGGPAGVQSGERRLDVLPARRRHVRRPRQDQMERG